MGRVGAAAARGRVGVNVRVRVGSKFYRGPYRVASSLHVRFSHFFL